VNQDLLRTIRLQKNVFKLELPSPAYDTSGKNQNYQTMPVEKKKTSEVQSKQRSRSRYESQDKSKIKQNSSVDNGENTEAGIDSTTVATKRSKNV